LHPMHRIIAEPVEQVVVESFEFHDELTFRVFCLLY
jgi:hypothetical protein